MDDYIERPSQPENTTRELEGGKHPAVIPTNVGSRRTRQSRRITVYGLSIVAVFIGLMTAATGCSPSTQKGPLHDSTMVDLLIELHLALARAETTNEIPPNIRDSILTTYNVDSTTYARAVTFYAERPDKYVEIYSRVLDRLNSERIPLGGNAYDERAAEAPPNSSVR